MPALQTESAVALGQLWTGYIYGTNTGKVFLDITGPPGNLVGTLRLADDQFGLAVLEVSGSFVDDTLAFNGTVKEAAEGVEFGDVSALGKLQQNGSFSGEWKSTIGTGGVFQLFPHSGARTSASSTGPEQLYTTFRDLGVLRLFKNDLLNLIETLQRKFPTSKVVVSHVERGAELAQYADEFKAKLNSIGRLQWIKLNVQSAESRQSPRIVTLDLGPNFNRILTQGSDESWVLGEAESLTSLLKQREHKLSTAIGKHRVNFNLLVALAALVALPELPLLQRSGFMALVVILLSIATSVQKRWIPNFVAKWPLRVPPGSATPGRLYFPG